MKIDHIGIAVQSLKEASPFYRALGLEELGRETVESQGVRVGLFEAGESRIELLEPLDGEGPIARHLEKRGEGIHHLAVKVDNLEEKVREMREEGIRFIGEKPTRGAEGKLIIFVHPKSSSGVLLELCEETGETEERGGTL